MKLYKISKTAEQDGGSILHSFNPVIDKNSKILILGTMLGPESLRKHEYYGHGRNAFWRIIYTLFREEMSNDYEEKKAFLLKHEIALWDVLASCEREGAGDAEIKNPVPNDFKGLLDEHPGIQKIYCNGATAGKLFERFAGGVAKEKGIPVVGLPSTSPANAVSFEDKLGSWNIILE